MAVSVCECANDNKLGKKSTKRLARRHYKKDSRFVLDLYTLTYDSHESLDSLGDLLERRTETNTKEKVTDDARIMFTGNIDKKNLHKKSKLQNGKSFQSCFMGQHLLRLDDDQYYDETLSLPIFQSKPLQNVNDISSLPVENPQWLSDLPSKQRRDYTTEIPKDNSNGQVEKGICNQIRDQNGTSIITKNSARWLQDLQSEIHTSLEKVNSSTNNHRLNCSIPYSFKTGLKKMGIDFDNSADQSLQMKTSRSVMTKLRSSQLQTIINDLHAHIEFLNEQLMKMLTERDELYSNRDSLMNHIGDIIAYLDAKEVQHKCNIKNYVPNVTNSKHNSLSPEPTFNSICSKNIISGLRFNRLASYIKN